MAELEIRALVEQAKSNIMSFYEVYDKKVKNTLTHPLFRSIDDDPRNSKFQILSEQVDLLENEMAKRIRDLVWA